ncbi:MAG: molybdopterin-binding protein [Christensenellales bacterium]
MIAEIVAIGTELLMGQIADSDAQMLSRELQSLGIAVYHHQVVGDNPQRMREALALALSRSDLVITTGGLGPTQDDLSKEIAAELLGLPMEFDPESWDAIRPVFRKNRAHLPDEQPQAGHVRQGLHDSAQRMRNRARLHDRKGRQDRRPAPRPAARDGGYVRPAGLRQAGEKDRRLHRLAVHPHLRHVGESQVAQTCARWIENGEGVTVAPYCALGECQLRVTARGRDEDEALRQVEPVVDAICGVLGDCVYDVTETSEGSMQEAAGRALVARRLTVSTAESCTGGMVAASLVDYPGISDNVCMKRMSPTPTRRR